MSDQATVYKTLLKSGLSKSYASQISSGARQPGFKKAIQIFRTTGLKLGPIQNSTSKEIASVARVVSPHHNPEEAA